MPIARLHRFLDQPAEAAPVLRDWGLTDIPRAHANLVRIATAGVTLDLLAVICDQLAEHLPGSSDPDMARNSLERFVAAGRIRYLWGRFSSAIARRCRFCCKFLPRASISATC